MDEKINAVLSQYHVRMQEERSRPREFRPEVRHTERDDRLLAVGPQTGQLINIIAKSLSAPTILEIGTSFGDSGIWLAEAARATGGRLITIELQHHKSANARDMAEKAGLGSFIDFRVGDALDLLPQLAHGIDFVLWIFGKIFMFPGLTPSTPASTPERSSSRTT